MIYNCSYDLQNNERLCFPFIPRSGPLYSGGYIQWECLIFPRSGLVYHISMVASSFTPLMGKLVGHMKLNALWYPST